MKAKMPITTALEWADMCRPTVDRCPEFRPDSIYCPREQAIVALADEVLRLRETATRNLIIGAVGALAGSLLVRLLLL